MSKNSAFKQFQINTCQDFVVSECIESRVSPTSEVNKSILIHGIKYMKSSESESIMTVFCNNLAVPPV